MKLRETLTEILIAQQATRIRIEQLHEEQQRTRERLDKELQPVVDHVKVVNGVFRVLLICITAGGGIASILITVSKLWH